MANAVPGGATPKQSPGKTKVLDLTGDQLSAIVTGAVFKALLAFALIGALFGALALVLTGCGSDAGAASGDDEKTATSESGGRSGQLVCSPGKAEACTGPAGCQGGQVCKDDGSGWEECACSADGSGGAPGAGGAAAAGSSGAGGSPVLMWMGAEWRCGDPKALQCMCAKEGVSAFDALDPTGKPCAQSCCILAEPVEDNCRCISDPIGTEGVTCDELAQRSNGRRVNRCGAD